MRLTDANLIICQIMLLLPFQPNCAWKVTENQFWHYLKNGVKTYYLMLVCGALQSRGIFTASNRGIKP